MKILVLSLALLSSPLIANANQYYPNNSSGFNVPNMNWGNNNNRGSNWNMPNMNWGNGNNGFNNGSNWSMPSMNWGNGTANNTANNWNMPNMNFGNNNTPNFNNAPNFNSVPHFNNAPVVKYMPPAVPTAPQFIPRLNNQKAPQAQMPAEIPTATAKLKKTFQAAEPAKLATTKIEVSTLEKIPTPSEVKGTILAPANKAMEATTK